MAVRERCVVPAHERGRALADLRRRFAHAVLLSTCGRTELYVEAADPDAAAAAALAWLARRAHMAAAVLQPYLETARGEGAVRRIARVACGLESAVEGEDEILGQVRRAWLEAGGAGALSPALDAAFRLAVRTGRQARRVGAPCDWSSLAETAAAHVALTVEALPAPHVLIAGSGPMGVRAARALRARLGPRLELALAGRTPERVAAHAEALDARPLTLAEMPGALARADAAVVGLRTPRTLLSAADVPVRPADRPLLIVDLSVPRAVEDAAGALPGVTLRNVDDLGGGEGAYARWTATERGRVAALVERAVRDFRAVTERTDAETTLTALRLRADGIRRAQLDRTLRRLPNLDAESRWAIDALTRAIVNRVLHDPTMRLKADPGGDAVRHVRELFF